MKTSRRGFLGLMGVGAAAAVAASLPESKPEWVDAPKKPLIPYEPQRVDMVYGHGLVYDVANDQMVPARSPGNRLLTMDEIVQRYNEAMSQMVEHNIQTGAYRRAGIDFMSGDKW